MESKAPSFCRAPSCSTKRRQAQIFFSLWGGAALGMVALLGREGCDPALGRSDPVATQLTDTTGWQVRHWLPVDPALAGIVAGQLAKRGPIPGVREEVFLVGRFQFMGDQLRRAGWTVTRAPSREEPRVEIFSPAGLLVWSGCYRAADFRGDQMVLLDTVVLGKVARGEVVAPFVPVGCVTQLPGQLERML